MPRFTTSDGVEIAAFDLGGDGPPLLLAHATGFHAMTWQPLAVALADRFHCYAFDERGHGDSGKAPGDDYRWEGFALDALAAVDGFGLERPLALGHSCGGALLLLAEQQRPGTFAALACFEPIVFPLDEPAPPNPDSPLAVGARRRREVFDSKDAAYERYASGPPFAALDPAALRAYVDHGFEELADGTVRLKCRGEDEARVYTMGSAHGAYQRLGEVACPVHLMCGSDTDAIGPDTLRAQAARLPQATVEVFDGLGHFGPLEDPARVGASVATALAAAVE